MEYNTHIDETATIEIIALIETFKAKWNHKDPEQFGQVFTEDAEFTDVVGQVALGRHAIIKQHIFPFENGQKIAILSINHLYLRYVSPEQVLVTANWKTVNSLSPSGEPLPERFGILQVLCRVKDGIWKISLVHNTDVSQSYKAATTENLKFIETER